jgi:hypothetical protein
MKADGPTSSGAWLLLRLGAQIQGVEEVSRKLAVVVVFWAEGAEDQHYGFGVIDETVKVVEEVCSDLACRSSSWFLNRITSNLSLCL